jgi:monoamine oxidase
MAGLTAARTLAEAGRRVILLEAASRVGGRILTVHQESPARNEVIELGAEFIHGRPPELWSLVEEARLETYELTGAHLTFAGGHLDTAAWSNDPEPDRAKPAESNDEDDSDPFPILENLATYAGPDISFAGFLALHPELPDAARQSAIGYVEGFNAADHRVIGVASLAVQQAAEDSIDGGRIFRVRDGYDRLPQFLAAKFLAARGTLLLNTLVERIVWNPGHVRIAAAQDGHARLWEASQAIITLPLGVLDQQSVTFVPIPAPIREARRLRMGHARRFTLLFREKFWAARPTGASHPQPIGDFRFLFAPASMPPVWWTPHPEPSNTLTGWVGGPRSEALANLTPVQLGDLACQTLAPVFSRSPGFLRGQLIACHAHDWQADGLSGGAYSYVPAGALDAPSKMTIPVDHTLYFAGEHTDTTGHWGTVHAAIRSGLRAAQQILHPAQQILHP